MLVQKYINRRNIFLKDFICLEHSTQQTQIKTAILLIMIVIIATHIDGGPCSLYPRARPIACNLYILADTDV